MILPALKPGILMAALVSASSFALAQDIDDLKAELGDISEQIFEAESVVHSGESADVREVARLRQEVLGLSGALVRNRILVMEGREATKIVVPVVEPDAAQARALGEELNEADARIRDAETEVGLLDGVEKSVARLRLESERLVRTQLLLAYFQARYGIAVPQSAVAGWQPDRTAGIQAQGEAEPERAGQAGMVDHYLVRGKLADGAWLAGWWTVESEAGSQSVTATNFSSYLADDDDTGLKALLEVSCEADEYRVAVITRGDSLHGPDSGRTPALDVDYRLDEVSVYNTDWRALDGGQTVALDGVDAHDLAIGMVGSGTLELEIWDGRDNLQTISFDLDGIRDVADGAFEDCVEEALEFSRQDYRLIQTLLNIAGHDAGAADGIWGSRSQGAMRQYQHAAGLTETGHPDRRTLKLLGLVE